MQDLLNQIANVPAAQWEILFGFLASSTVIAGLVQAVKHHYSLPDLSKRLMFLLTGLSTLSTLLDWYIGNSGLTALHYLGKYNAVIFAFSVLLHVLIGSPLYKVLREKLAIYNAGKAITAIASETPAPLPLQQIVPMEQHEVKF